ncbi:hypothetical protein BC826DRAFT_522875 [Russula brevipes]|nr:hypothetical protein BC826DRAFT_522875 [Russula brevipes]
MPPFFSRALAGSTVPAPALPRSPLIIASLLLPLLLSLPTANAACTGDPNNRATERGDSPSSQTKTGMPTLVILTIVGAACSSSLHPFGHLSSRDLILPNSVFPRHGLYLRILPYAKAARAQEARRPPQGNVGVPKHGTHGGQADLHAFQRARCDPDPAARLRCGDDEPTVLGSCVCRVMWG